MFRLRCSVRNCTQPLEYVDGSLVCANRHHFDRAKQGYWSLLQPQDRKSKSPGDSDDAVLARRRWLETGHMSGLVDVLLPWFQPDGATTADEAPRTVDLGCGEGTLGHALFADEPEGFCGIDLSKRALRLAARAWPQATWVLANADRTLPLIDQSIDRVVSLFGRRPETEIHRVLKPGGICVVAVPGEDDLIELRQEVQLDGRRRNRWESISDEFTTCGFTQLEQRRWTSQIRLEPETIADALSMTYRAVRRSQAQRLRGIESMQVTLEADLILFRRSE